MSDTGVVTEKSLWQATHAAVLVLQTGVAGVPMQSRLVAHGGATAVITPVAVSAHAVALGGACRPGVKLQRWITATVAEVPSTLPERCRL